MGWLIRLVNGALEKRGVRLQDERIRHRGQLAALRNEVRRRLRQR